MCGIFGMIGTANPEVAERVIVAMRHRGPDDQGIWLNQTGCPVTLANVRLAIVDLSPAGHMPMPSADGQTVIAYNGEVFNFAEIRAELQAFGRHFRSQTDTEVILQAYQQWGAACVHKLRGMFAFLIWDQSSQTLFAARDRLGIKPLYYTQTAQGWLFASEVQTLLATGLVEAHLNHDMLSHYLSFYAVPPPATLLTGIWALLPGHTLTLQTRGQALYLPQPSIERYWQPPTVQQPVQPLPELRQQLRELLTEAIRLRMIADVPVGAFLSGGVDSSAVVALMTEISGQRLKTFSVGFDHAGKNLDERSYAQLVATRYQTDHTEVVVTGEQVVDLLPRYITALDQPTGDGLNTFLVSWAAAQHVKVVLSGLGGDELFAGYGHFRELQQAERLAPVWRALPQPLRQATNYALQHLATYTGRAGIGEIGDWLAGDYLSRYTRRRTLFGNAQQRTLLQAGYPIYSPRTILQPYLAPDLDIINQTSRLELLGYMAHTLLRDSDMLSMAHSLELRVPLIDHKLVEFVLGIPGSQKLYNYQVKPLLTSTLADLLPSEIITRRKQGFEMPIAAWLRAELRPVVLDALSPARLQARGIFQADAVLALRDRFLNGQGMYMPVWALIVLELWLRKLNVSL